MRIFIIHGWGGNPDEPHLKWIREQLVGKGYDVIAPAMPNTDEPDIELWTRTLSKLVGSVREDYYFIGHSIGCQTILRFLEKQDNKAGGAIFIAGWFNLENMESDYEERIADPWINTPIDPEKIRKVLPRSTLIISDNDPYGAFDFNIQKFQELDSDIIILPNAGHLTAEFGITEIPQVIEVMGKYLG